MALRNANGDIGSQWSQKYKSTVLQMLIHTTLKELHKELDTHVCISINTYACINTHVVYIYKFCNEFVFIQVDVWGNYFKEADIYLYLFIKYKLYLTLSFLFVFLFHYGYC